MSCQCATEALECMPRPKVSDLCCPSKTSCCGVKSLTIDDIDAAAVTQFELDGTVMTDTPASHLAYLQGSQLAIDAAFEQLASRSCMATYAAGCCISTRVCVPGSCSCCCRSADCDTCARETVPIIKVSRCVDPSRVASVTVNGEPASLNGDDPDAAYDLSVCHRIWRLHGFNPACGGHADIVFQLKPPTALWTQAVTALACSRMPCKHDKSCDVEADREYAIALRDRGLTGVDAADALIRKCVNGDKVRLGRSARREEFLRWGNCPEEV